MTFDERINEWLCSVAISTKRKLSDCMEMGRLMFNKTNRKCERNDTNRYQTTERYKTTYKEKEIITYCQVRLLLIPSLKRSRNERCRLGPGPVIIWLSLLGDDDDDEVKNFVGLRCCWDSLSEWDGEDDLKLKFVLLSGDRCWCCFGDWSSRGVAIWVVEEWRWFARVDEVFLN